MGEDVAVPDEETGDVVLGLDSGDRPRIDDQCILGTSLPGKSFELIPPWL